MAIHSSILAWKISRTEEPGGLQSMGLHSWTRLKRLIQGIFPTQGSNLRLLHLLHQQVDSLPHTVQYQSVHARDDKAKGIGKACNVRLKNIKLIKIGNKALVIRRTVSFKVRK